jgi:hypothetical protein
MKKFFPDDFFVEKFVKAAPQEVRYSRKPTI